MALVLQNREEAELREILVKFLKAMEFQHEIPVDYSVMAIGAHQMIENKIQKLLGDWLHELSIPELLRVRKMCIEATPLKEEQKPKPQVDSKVEGPAEDPKPSLKVKKRTYQ